jgi:hypothetical protein
MEVAPCSWFTRRLRMREGGKVSPWEGKAPAPEVGKSWSKAALGVTHSAAAGEKGRGETQRERMLGETSAKDPVAY